MRASLEGTQASHEGESHTQDANVAEVNHGEPGNGKLKSLKLSQFVVAGIVSTGACDLLLMVRARAYSVEVANPRHEHEWKV
jgi:hypothetical protein